MSRSLGIAVLSLALVSAAAAAESEFGRPTPPAPAGLAKAAFAGGCFWCMQPAFDKVPGVVRTTVGYTGGFKDRPTYEEVSDGTTGHAESIEVLFDPKKVTYETLLGVFWHNVDPVTKDAQFCDHGHQYRTAIFTRDQDQQKSAESSKKALEAGGKLPGPIVTEIVAAGPFWPAEDYHQSYYEKNPVRYKFYRLNCGRDARLRDLWGAEAGGHGADAR